MTTAIALETSKGNLDLALALGLILIVIALAVNASVTILRGASADHGNGLAYLSTVTSLRKKPNFHF